MERFQGTSTSAQQVQEHLAAIAQKTCLAGLKGVECLGKNIKRDSSTPDSTLSLLYSGVGYDAWTHSVRPPIFKSGQAVAEPMPIRKQTISGNFKDARQFYSMVYPMNQQNTFYNGLYTHNGGSSEIFSQFFKGNFSGVNMQHQYATHQVSSVEGRLTDDFKYLIDLLPEENDADLYQKVIDFFGNAIAVKVTYGGIVDLTVSIRSCFSDPRMEQYVTNELNSVLSGDNSSVPLGYARYHKVSQLAIGGGNPELSNVEKRVASFYLNPVPIKVNSVPIWQAFPEGPKRRNIKSAFDAYELRKRKSVDQMIEQLEVLRTGQGPQTFSGFGKTIKEGLIIDLGQGTVASDQTIEFSKLRYKINRLQQTALVFQDCYATARIIRHSDLTFHLDLIQDCLIDGKVVNMGNVNSSPVLQNCASVKVQGGGKWNIKYYDVAEIYVCSGCQPYVSPDGKQLTCGCQYVE